MLTKKTLALGAAFAAGLTLTAGAMAKDAEFGATPMQAGYTLADKTAEGKCGGEGKCGASKMKKEGSEKAKEATDAAKTDAKEAEGKAKAEGKCGADKMKAHAEGKCGADKKKEGAEKTK